LTLFEELVERGGLEIALANRSEEELEELIKFLLWKISDHKYQCILIEVARVLMDMYMGVFGGISKRIDELIMSELNGKVNKEIEIIKTLKEMKGMIDNILVVANIVEA
jgi:U3 small nucleolar RNA-associated protein 15